jgi:transcription elongation factor GreB
VSKAFTKDDDGAVVQFVRSRAPLPRGIPNYVTARGLAALRDERVGLEGERSRRDAAGDLAAVAALSARLAELEGRIGSAEVVIAPAGEARAMIRFSATVTVQNEGDGGGGERRYQIVGVDEADAGAGRIAFTAPLARALLGRQVGDTVSISTLHGEESWSVRAITYDGE